MSAEPPELDALRLTVTRSARAWRLGRPSAEIAELWLVLHGYGQLAEPFLREFHPVAGRRRLIVAPEALSRFYRGSTSAAAHAQVPVGASWMTREDREAEIADQIAFLDLLYEQVTAPPVGAGLVLRVLGFSQGAAAASRWATLGGPRADELILWGGLLAADLDLDRVRDRMAGGRITWVRGVRDTLVDSDDLRRQVQAMNERGVATRTIEFDGGHELTAAALERVARGA